MVVPSPSPKARLRRDALEARRAYARSLGASLRRDLEAKLAAIVLPHLAGARTVAGYHAMRDEISPYAILEALDGHQAVALPWFAGRDARMMFRSAPASEPGPWNVLQPRGSADALAPDLVLVPLVLADRGGARIGHGKGHYDRALAHLRESAPVFTIGIAWEPQIADEPLPADPWDIPLDAIATPAEWIMCRRSQAGESRPGSG
ncbi:MAG: 5-formyltetrahydrofolate cyclo-ligase [Alphaproteobacteria bacterium]|nr:5-formyltetrahydrofolate cyclo-ligase [Alphaproteobacteria bacterium]